jgi:hypothetical protein
MHALRTSPPPFVRALDRLIVAVGLLGRHWLTDRRHARVVTRPLGELIHHACHAVSLEDAPIPDDAILRDHHRAAYKAAVEMMSALNAVSAKRWAPVARVRIAREATATLVRAFEHRLVAAARRDDERSVA